jgi:hypothetical protein
MTKNEKDKIMAKLAPVREQIGASDEEILKDIEETTANGSELKLKLDKVFIKL